MALAALVPVALVLSPSRLNIPVDLALAAIIPFHTYYGMSQVITDYMPRSTQTLWLAILAVIALLMLIGFLNLSLRGPGLTESVKSLWRENPQTTK